MNAVFADAQYWIAIVHPNDQWHEPAKQARQALGNVILVTTDEVLSEFLAGLCKGGPTLRRTAVRLVRAILKDPNVKVIPQTRDGFLRGLERYANREDKQYSLTDCISMNAMESEGLADALSNDHHFEQEGFTVLIQPAS